MKNMKNLIKQKKLSTASPWYVTGLIDGEGSWLLSISKNSKCSLGYKINLGLEIGLHRKDLDLLKGLQAYFKVGGIYKNSDNMMHYKVSSIKDLTRVIIPHFDKYPLVTQKRADFEILKHAIDIINKGPLTPEDFQKIVNLKASLNRGLSDELKEFFPDTIPVRRPSVEFLGIPDSNWLSGFVEGEGCFFINTYKSPRSKLGMAVQLVFAITQHIRDKELLEGLKGYLDCGKYSVRKGNEAGDYKVISIADINEKIIPFFLKYPLQGSKSLNFADFCLAANIMKVKGHLTLEGLEEIQKIKMGMNTRRST